MMLSQFWFHGVALRVEGKQGNCLSGYKVFSYSRTIFCLRKFIKSIYINIVNLEKCNQSTLFSCMYIFINKSRNSNSLKSKDTHISRYFFRHLRDDLKSFFQKKAISKAVVNINCFTLFCNC